MIYIFVTNNAIGSRLIRWGTNSEASHMIIARRPRWNSRCVEARGDKNAVVERRLDDAIGRNKIVTAFELDITAMEADGMFRKVRSKVGLEYDFKGIGFFSLSTAFFVKLLGIGRNKENKWADKEKWYCSELMMVNKKTLSKYTKINEYSEQFVSPQDAIDILRGGDPRYVSEIDLALELDLT